MRLFVAIDLPEETKKVLQKVQAVLPRAQMSKAGGFHLTLKFLGDCDDELKVKVEKELKEVKFNPFEANLQEIGTFGGSHPRVVWIGLKCPESIFETVKEMEMRMANLGFAVANRFVPHLTLARIKYVKNSRDFLEELNKISVAEICGDVNVMKFTVKEFFLFQSQLSSSGAVYTKLAKFS
ncbi:RNA 2',3'-cyclic phosphodiesterase [Candidatus Peregrinibacteria bacterium]|nr:RNA 2',3'-cyclic phosphodiesterase [Candidatus Peregrinibacteria bacterium]